MGGSLSVTPEDPASRIARLERELASAVARAESADRRARVLYDGGSDPMLEVDGAGVVRGANGAAVQRLGAGVVGKDLSELFRPGDSETVERMFAGAMETSLDRELQLLDGTGVLICGIAPSASGRIVVLMRVRASSAPTVTDDERRYAAVGRMASLLAHELNNPLTVLQIRTDLLREDGPAHLQDQLQQLGEAMTRVARSVKTFQRVARPHRPAREPLVVAELIDRAVGQLEGGGAGVELDPIPAGFEVVGDEDALTLALEQLVGVARGPGHVRIRVEGFNQHVRIEVASGARLWSGGSSRDTPQDRTQELAMAIATIVVRDHGGEIRTSERDGAGVMRIELPRAVAEGTSRGREPVRVLVVDDEPLVAAVLADWCLRKGHACKVAGSAEEAMTLLTESVRYDAVLVDERLPGASGIQLLQWISRERPTLVSRSALMSGAPPPDPLPWAFLAKPFTRRRLAELVEKLLSR